MQPKKCLLCMTVDEADQATCLACGEATWEMLEVPAAEDAPAGDDAPAADDSKPKRGRPKAAS